MLLSRLEEENAVIELLLSFDVEFSCTTPGKLLAGPEGGGHPALPLGAEPGPPSSERGGDLPAKWG